MKLSFVLTASIVLCNLTAWSLPVSAVETPQSTVATSLDAQSPANPPAAQAQGAVNPSRPLADLTKAQPATSFTQSTAQPVNNQSTTDNPTSNSISFDQDFQALNQQLDAMPNAHSTAPNDASLQDAQALSKQLDSTPDAAAQQDLQAFNQHLDAEVDASSISNQPTTTDNSHDAALQEFQALNKHLDAMPDTSLWGVKSLDDFKSSTDSKINYREACKWYQKAVLAGNEVAASTLASLADPQLGLITDAVEAKEFCKVAIRSLQKFALSSIDKSVSESLRFQEMARPASRPPKEMWNEVAHCGAENIIAAASKLADIYAEGTAAPKNIAESIHWRQIELAQLKRSFALLPNVSDAWSDTLNIATIYDNGQAGQRDLKQANFWYAQTLSLLKKESLKGTNYMPGYLQTLIGDMYFTGKGVSRNTHEAVTWYKNAANTGEPVAEYKLSQLYLKGIGVKQNLLEAKSLEKKSVSFLPEYGDGNRQLLLDLLLAASYDPKDIDGGLIKNKKEALKWYEKFLKDMGKDDFNMIEPMFLKHRIALLSR